MDMGKFSHLAALSNCDLFLNYHPFLLLHQNHHHHPRRHHHHHPPCHPPHHPHHHHHRGIQFPTMFGGWGANLDSCLAGLELIDIKYCPTNLRSHFPARHGWRQVGRSAPAVKRSKRRMLWNVTVIDDVCPNTCQVSNCSIFLVGCCSPILVVPQNNPWPILSPPTGWPSWNPGPKLVDFAVPVFQKPHIDPTTLPDLPVRPKTKTIFAFLLRRIRSSQQKYTSPHK